MKKLTSTILLSLSLFSFNLVAQECVALRGKSYLATRSQSLNAAFDLVGWQDFLWQYCPCSWYSNWYIAPQYGQSFRAHEIAGYFFGTNVLHISGSQVEGRDNERDILADYFGLPTTYQSHVNVEPYVRNTQINFGWFVGGGNWYAYVHAPYVWTRSKVSLCEIPETEEGQTPYPALYMDNGEVTPPAETFSQAVSGCFTYGDVVEPLKYGRFGCSQGASALADLRGFVGYCVVNRERGHAGFDLRFAAPTGNRPTAEFLFEPIVGNGHHWEFGAGFTGHGHIWRESSTEHFDVFVDLSMTHLFKDCQRRSFDFNWYNFNFGSQDPDCPKEPFECNEVTCRDKLARFGSRYILLKEFDEAGNYTGNTVPAINRTTLLGDVSYSVQFDMAIMFAYVNCGHNLNFGYEAWVRSKEDFDLKECLPENKYALKGIQNVAINVPPVELSNATQTNATLMGNPFDEQDMVADMPSPQFINTQDINISSGEAEMSFTHKLFINYGYFWEERFCHVMPFVTIGGQVEFDGQRGYKRLCPNKNTVSQWAVWAKMGIAL